MRKSRALPLKPKDCLQILLQESTSLSRPAARKSVVVAIMTQHRKVKRQLKLNPDFLHGDEHFVLQLFSAALP